MIGARAPGVARAGRIRPPGGRRGTDRRCGVSGDEKTLPPAARVAGPAFGVTILVWAAVAEYLIRGGYFAVRAEPLLEAGNLGVLRLICVVLAIAAAGLALMIKRAVISGQPAAMLALVKRMMRQVHARSCGTGFGIVLVPLGLSESVIVLGFVLFFLGGGRRELFYPFLAVALMVLLSVLPNAAYGARVAELDREVRGEGR